MNYFGKTKGTELEKIIAQLAQGETIGGAMYYALAKIYKSTLKSFWKIILVIKKSVGYSVFGICPCFLHKVSVS